MGSSSSKVSSGSSASRRSSDSSRQQTKPRSASSSPHKPAKQQCGRSATTLTKADKPLHGLSAVITLPSSNKGLWEQANPAYVNEMAVFACLYAWGVDSWQGYKQRMEKLLMRGGLPAAYLAEVPPGVSKKNAKVDQRRKFDYEERFFAWTSTAAYLQMVRAKEQCAKINLGASRPGRGVLCPFRVPVADAGYVEGRVWQFIKS